MAAKKSNSTGKKTTSSAKKNSSSKRGSSSSTVQKRVVKEATKAAKKNPVAFVIVVAIILALGIGGFFGYRYYKTEINPDISFVLNGPNAYSIGLGTKYVEKGVQALYAGEDISSEVKTSYYKGADKAPVTEITTEAEETFYVDYAIQHKKLDQTLTRTVVVAKTAPISISFLELGNKFTGDSVYIKAGETDILIDAGSRENSANAITDFLKQEGRVEDGKLEYVVATHAHQDHIAGFAGNKSNKSVFENFETETIITFAKTNATSAVYTRFAEQVENEVQTGAKHYTALECVNEINGAQKVYTIAPGITMEVLNQRFYDEKTSDENDYSVCLLFTQGENHYLFTGDLEKDGEESLVEMNNLPEVTLFKGAHHGSYTANTDKLLDVIKPKTVCICCCAGSTEYTKDLQNTFPAQAAIDRLGKHTDQIYVTTLVTDDEIGYTSMNGTITCKSLAGNGLSDFTVHGSNNDTILKETAWFKANRKWPTASN